MEVVGRGVDRPLVAVRSLVDGRRAESSHLLFLVEVVGSESALELVVVGNLFALAQVVVDSKSGLAPAEVDSMLALEPEPPVDEGIAALEDVPQVLEALEVLVPQSLQRRAADSSAVAVVRSFLQSCEVMKGVVVCD